MSTAFLEAIAKCREDRILPEELIQELEQSLRRSERVQPEARPVTESLRWLALVPLWTPVLARFCGFPLPSDVRSPAEWFQQAVKGGDCESEFSLAKPWLRCYWMPVARRRAFLKEWKNDGERIALLQRIGLRLLAATKDDDGLPGVLGRWRHLAAQAGEALDATFLGYLDRDLPAQARSLNESEFTRCHSAGIRWAAAGRALGEVIDNGGLRFAYELAEFRVDLFQRRQVDEQRLKTYVNRRAAERAFEDLLASPNEEWALHYCGHGGMGKTMLLRHLARRAAGLGLATVRIDFDRLNPDYPARKPALLIARLAEDFRMNQTDTGGSTYFESVTVKVLSFHREVNVATDSQESILENLQRWGIISTLANGIESLKKRPLIVFDTCEELGKYRTDGEQPRNVFWTFTILELLQKELPELRVIFAGRRALARSGAGSGTAAKEADQKLEKRPYLKLHELHGFTRDEARECVLRIVPDATDDHIKAIFVSSHVDECEIVSKRTESEREEECSPYLLTMRANRLRSEPGLTAAELRTADWDAFIAERYLDQIPNEGIRTAYLVMAIYGDIDRELAQALFERPEVIGDFFRELQAADWTDEDSGFVGIAAWLREPARRYFERRSIAPSQSIRDSLLRRCVEFTSNVGNADAIMPRHLAFTARLLVEYGADRLYEWWNELTRRFRDKLPYSAVREWAREALGDEADSQPSLESFYWSVMAGTELAAGAREDAFDDWAKCERALPQAPEPMASSLRIRAQAGMRARRKIDAAEDLQSFLELTRSPEQIPAEAWAGVLAAMDAVLERAEDSGADSIPERFAGDCVRVAQFHASLKAGERSLAAWTATAAARALSFDVTAHRQPSLAKRWFAEAIRELRGVGEYPSTAFDWPTIPDIKPRICLEYLRAIYSIHEAPYEALRPVIDVWVSALPWPRPRQSCRPWNRGRKCLIANA